MKLHQLEIEDQDLAEIIVSHKNEIKMDS